MFTSVKARHVILDHPKREEAIRAIAAFRMEPDATDDVSAMFLQVSTSLFCNEGLDN